MDFDVEEEKGSTLVDPCLLWVAWALLLRTRTQLNNDHSDACEIVQRWNDDCGIVWCEDDDYAHGFLMHPKSLRKTDSDRPDSAGSTGGGLKILLPEYKNQEPDTEVTEVEEQAVGCSKRETGG